MKSESSVATKRKIACSEDLQVAEWLILNLEVGNLRNFFYESVKDQKSGWLVVLDAHPNNSVLMDQLVESSQHSDAHLPASVSQKKIPTQTIQPDLPDIDHRSPLATPQQLNFPAPPRNNVFTIISSFQVLSS